MNKNFNDFLKSSLYNDLLRKYLDDVRNSKSDDKTERDASLLIANIKFSKNLLQAYHEWLFKEARS